MLVFANYFEMFQFCPSELHCTLHSPSCGFGEHLRKCGGEYNSSYFITKLGQINCFYLFSLQVGLVGMGLDQFEMRVTQPISIGRN